MRNSFPLFLLFLAATLGALVWKVTSERSTGENSAADQSASTLGASKSSVADYEIRPALGEAFHSMLRVNLTSRAVASVQVSVEGDYEIRPIGQSRVLRRGSRMAETPVRTTTDALQIGDEEFPFSELEIVSLKSTPIQLGKSKYRGLIRFHRVSPGKLIAVNGVGLESYVSSVIDGEMPADFPDAARRSQAIVARTYALYQQRRSRKHPHFDLYATTRSQKYLGVEYRDRRGRLLAGESAQSRRLADETRGLVATYRGELFCTYYSAVCGGHTTQGKAVFADAAPPLKRVDCDWCRDARFFRWTASLSRSQLTKAVKRHLGTSKQPFGSITELSVAPGRSTQAGELAGTINQFQAVDEHRAYRLSAAQLRRWLPTGTLYSPRFTVSAKDDAFLFSGQGHGHGVGLCQWGARGMAQAGKTTMEILEHYYPGSEVSIVETLFQNPQAAGLAPVEGSTNPDGPPSEGLAGVP